MLVRQRVAEIMDDPLLDEGLHRAALKGLEQLNAIGNSKMIIASKIEKVARTFAAAEKPLRVLDLACGAGDQAIALSKYFASKNLPVEIHGLDISDTAVAYAQARYQNCVQSCGAIGKCTFSRLDVIDDQLPNGFDVIITSLFTHHLDPAQIIALLAKMAAGARHIIMVNDLERSLTNLWGVTLATRLVTSSPVVHHDGPASVRAAFTAAEMLQMALDAGLHNASVSRQFPCRILLTAEGKEKNVAV